MRKYTAILFAIVLVFYTLTGCSDGGNKTPLSSPSEGSPSTGELKELKTWEADSQSIDIDLTIMSSTMVYVEVYNMMTQPEDYLGKTIKVRGEYYVSYYDVTEQYYHFVVIADATACCTQGLEFVWQGEHIYPEDYPADGKEIELTGVFSSYEEEGITYYCIDTDTIHIF